MDAQARDARGHGAVECGSARNLTLQLSEVTGAPSPGWLGLHPGR
jgi:hypothetical protein